MTQVHDTEIAFAGTQYRRQAVKDGIRAFSAQMQSPGDIAHSLGETTSSGLARAGETLRTQPLPCALTAIGLVWLAFGSGKTAPEPPTTRALSRWEDEGGPCLPPEENASQIHDAGHATSAVPTLALGVGALAVGALMSDGLRRRDPLRGKAGQSPAAQLVSNEVTAALNDTETAFNRLIGGVGRGLIDQAQSVVDRFLSEASRTVDGLSRATQADATNTGLRR